MAPPRPGEKAPPLMGSEETVIMVALLIWLAFIFFWPWVRPPLEFIILGNADWQYHLLDKIHLLRDANGLKIEHYIDYYMHHPMLIGTVPWSTTLWIAEDIASFYHMFLAYVALVGFLFWKTYKNRPTKSYKTVYSLTGKELTNVPYIFNQKITFKPARKFLLADYKSKTLSFIVKKILTLTFISRLIETKKEWVKSGPNFFEYQSLAWKGTKYSSQFVPESAGPAEDPAKSPQQWMKENGITITNGEIDIAKAEQTFKSQLGAHWTGIENAPYYMQAIAILSWLNYTHKSGKPVDEFRGILDLIHCTSKSPKEAESSTRKQMAKYFSNKQLVEDLNRRGNAHAFLNTAMMAIYGAGGPMAKWGGGDAGVNASSGFRWVKKIDRTFWYCMNNVGREAHHIECAGAVSHFHAERVERKRLDTPYVASAIEGLEITVREDGVMTLDDYFRERIQF